ncbi:hypothetical protein H206_01566 [Candidatus Electrothrix aarhusensis]|uniref:Uncharacterized protein n=1 Tax=Candidatus Electrothrix aarhusensis TaxID=1859131 RepID=A0A444J023_9BACT|nr:hypothetical protein H206_01566 [Candidatus Electrothrix aarhusensis]
MGFRLTVDDQDQFTPYPTAGEFQEFGKRASKVLFMELGQLPKQLGLSVPKNIETIL